MLGKLLPVHRDFLSKPRTIFYSYSIWWFPWFLVSTPAAYILGSQLPVVTHPNFRESPRSLLLVTPPLVYSKEEKG